MKLRKIMAFLLCMALLFGMCPQILPTEVQAASNGTCGDNLTWTLDDTGTLTISGTGKMYDYVAEEGVCDSPWYAYRGQIKKLKLEPGVASIGSWAFLRCTGLTSVTIPDGVTTFGNFAFSECTNLTTVSLPVESESISSGMFCGCSNLHEITIPETVTTIGAYAFEESGLTKVLLPDSVTTLGDAAFRHCHSLISVTLGSGLKNVGFRAFYDTPITSVTVTGVDTWLAICTAVETGGRDQLCILDDAGQEMTDLVLDSAVTEIPAVAFYNCKHITSVTIPASVQSIGQAAFKGCDSLSGIWVDENNVNYSSDKCGVLFNKEKTVLVQAPGAIVGEYTVPSDVKNIGEDAFFCCRNLETVTIPDGVKTIGDGAFMGCEKLTAVSIPTSMETIDCNAFWEAGLGNVYFGGTQEQREAIFIEVYNDPLLNATWHYQKMYAQDDLQSVIDGAESGTTVIMTQDLAVSSVAVWDGVILDLNGYTLTADYFTCYGSVTDGETGGTALLKANKHIHIAGEDSFLPIYDTAAGGYRFYQYELQNLGYKTVEGNTDTLKLGFRLNLSNTAGYSVLSQTTDDAINAMAYISWGNMPGAFGYEFSDDTLRRYAALVAEDIADNGTSAKAIILTLTGIDSLGSDVQFAARPEMVTAPGVTAQADTATWSVQ